MTRTATPKLGAYTALAGLGLLAALVTLAACSPQTTRQAPTVTPSGFLGDLAGKRFASIDEWQTQMQLKSTARARVHLYAGALAQADRALTGVRAADSVEEAVLASVRESGDPQVAVIPEGPYLVPFYRPAGS